MKFKFSGSSLLKANSDTENTSKLTEKFEGSERKYHKPKITYKSYYELHCNGIITELREEFYNHLFLSSINTGRFMLFSVITNICIKKTKDLP